MGLVIFDMDETLISSLSIWAEAPKHLLEERMLDGGEELEDLFYNEGLTKVITRLKEVYGFCESKEELFEILSDLCLKGYEEKATLKPGVTEGITSIREQGHFTCVLSANSQKLVNVIKNRFSNELPMDGWFSCKTLGYGKDNEKVYDLVSSFFGLSIGSCALIDDAPYAVEKAFGIGIKAIKVDATTDFTQLAETIGRIGI